MNWYTMIKKAGVQWKTMDYSPDSQEVVEVNIAKFDASWQNNPFYIAPEEAGNPKKYEVWEQRYSEGFHGEMPSAMIGDDNVVGFLDGRHRYSVSRNNGDTTIPMIVPKEQADKFYKLFS